MTLGPAPRWTRLFLAWIVVVASMALAAKPAAAQFQNPIQAAKDAYNKSKAQQQPQQKPGQPAPAQGQTQQAGSPQQRPGQQPGPGQNSAQTNDVGPFTPPSGTKIVPTAMAPMQQGAQFAVSPVGIHVATLSHNGSRPVINTDTPVPAQREKAAVWRASQPSGWMSPVFELSPRSVDLI